MGRRHTSLVFVDQVASGASNVLPLMIVGYFATSAEFGLVALNFAVTAFALSLGRTVLAEAGLGGVLQSESWLQSGSAFGCLLAPVGFAVATLTFHEPSIAALQAAGLWMVAVQDQHRLHAISEHKAPLALTADTIWLVGTLSAQAIILFIGIREPSALFLCYLGGVSLSLAFIVRGRSLRELKPKFPSGVWAVAPINAVGAGTVFAVGLTMAGLGGAERLGEFQAAQLFVTPLSLLIGVVPTLAIPRMRHATSLEVRTARRPFIAVAAAVGTAISLLSVFAVPYIFPLQDPKQIQLAISVAAFQGAITAGSAVNYGALRIRDDLVSYRRGRMLWIAATWIAVVLAADAPNTWMLVAAMSVGSLLEFIYTGTKNRSKRWVNLSED